MHPTSCAKGVTKSESEARKALGGLCGTPSKSTVKNLENYESPFSTSQHKRYYVWFQEILLSIYLESFLFFLKFKCILFSSVAIFLQTNQWQGTYWCILQCLKSMSIISTRLISRMLFPKLLTSESPLHPLYESCIVVWVVLTLKIMEIFPASR